MTSDNRYKNNIQVSDLGLDFIKKLNPRIIKVIAIMVNAPTLVSFDTFIFRVYMLKQNYQKILANWHCSFSGVPVSSYT